MASRALCLLVLALGVTIALIGLLHIAFGPAIIRGASEFNASLDSEDRFFGAIFVGYGAMWVWSAMDVAGRARIIAGLAATFLLGGLARLVSVWAVGRPDPLYVALTVVELVLPLVIMLLLRTAGRAGPPSCPGAVSQM